MCGVVGGVRALLRRRTGVVVARVCLRLGVATGMREPERRLPNVNMYVIVCVVFAVCKSVRGEGEGAPIVLVPVSKPKPSTLNTEA